MSKLQFLSASLTAIALSMGAAGAESTFTILRDTGWGAQNLNPFVTADRHLLPTNSAIYETLFYVNTVTGEIVDVLGTGYKWSNGNQTLTIKTRPGVKWNDGQAFNAKDVAFTFNYLHKYPELDLAGLWGTGLKSVAAQNDTTVVFNFSNKNTPVLTYVANVPIVPEHIWASVTKPGEFTNPKPVATGPYVFDTFTMQALKVVKNPNYWMKDKPAVDSLVWIVKGGNDGVLLSLLKGEGDFSYVGLSDVKNGYAAKNPAVNVYYWPVNNGNYLYFNTTKAPFNNAKFRHAIAQAIDTQNVADKAYNGVANGLNSSGVIPAQQGKWLTAAAKANAYSFNPEKAKAELKAAGFKTDAAGKLLGRDGKRLPAFKILVGEGWTDFITMASVIGENLRQVGIDTSIDQEAWSAYSGGLQTANFDMGISWGWGNGDTPYYFFYQDFAPEFSAKKVGDAAVSNLSRYTNPVITNALKTFRETSDLTKQRKAVEEMVKVFQRDAPAVPLTDRNQFATFNASHFTGFPSMANPYNDGSPDDQAGARLLYLNIKPK